MKRHWSTASWADRKPAATTSRRSGETPEMFKSLISFATGVALAATLATAAHAATDAAKPDDSKKVTELIFEAKHIATLTAGTELVYKFERKPSDEKLLGAGYTDDMKLKIDGDGVPGKKNVTVTIFSGERARDPNRITDMDGNPMLIVYLDACISHFRELAGGDHAYLKNRMSKSFSNAPKLDPVKISYKGADVDGYRITVLPFTDDPARAKMRGFEGSEFQIVVSDKIPGHFAQMISKYVNTQKDAPSLNEKVTLDGVGDVK
jgi:hypothetical protein